MKIATTTTIIPLILLIASTGLANEPTVEENNPPQLSSTNANMSTTTTKETQTQLIKVKVTLTAEAEAAIDAGETIIVSASYFASPKPGIALPEDWRGVPWITFARMEREIAKPGTVNFAAPEFNPDALPWALPDSYGVNIGVFSGRQKSDDNILDCEFFENSLKAATKDEISLSCDLL